MMKSKKKWNIASIWKRKRNKKRKMKMKKTASLRKIKTEWKR
jgi:hypothetical protein